MSLDNRARIGMGTYNATGCESATKAQDDALRHYLADLPDPKKFAHEMRLSIAEGLALVSMPSGNCQPHHRRELGRNGLCDVRSGFLTAFGMKVRAAMLEDRG